MPRRKTSWYAGRNSSTSSLAFSRVNVCIALVFAFTLSDFLLKPLPFQVGVVLRYTPEAVLYISAGLVFLNGRSRTLFPLTIPLCLFATTIGVTALVNRSQALSVLSDFHSYWRFVAFAYVLWKTQLSWEHIERLINGVLTLAALEMGIALTELFGGVPVREFFTPALKWASGETSVWSALDGESWISGTFSNYNHFGMFMVMACVLALSMYFVKGERKHLLLAVGGFAAVLVSFSRHSITNLFVAISLLLLLRRKVAIGLGVAGTAAVCYFVIFSLIGTGIGKQNGESSLQRKMASSITSESLSGDPNANVRLYLIKNLPPRFLRYSPFIGEGPGSADPSAPMPGMAAEYIYDFHATAHIPRWTMFYLGDVVWVFLLGLYGCCGLAAYALILGAVVWAAYRVLRGGRPLHEAILADACLTLILVYVLTGFFSLTVVARDTIPIFWVVVGVVLSVSCRCQVQYRGWTRR